MDDKAEADIRELCTRIGCIMEDASVIALIWIKDQELTIEARLGLLREAHDEISSLIGKATCLLDKA
ncbi:MAG: hypothetical protein ACRCY3_15785 [Sphingorhabdus sp.]